LVKPEGYADVIEKVKNDTGKPPALAILTHVDGNYGNIVDAAKVGEISHEYDVPFLLNTAYSSGRMPVDGGKLNADFITVSGHKSWAAGGGNIGLLVTTGDWNERVFRYSVDFKVKPLEIIGCSTRGAATVALMASLPYVKERVKQWGEEVEKARWLSDKLEALEIHPVGEKPRNHDLCFYESEVLYEISKTHKKKNFYLYNELKAHGVTGIKAGLTKHFKLSTYRLTKKQVEHVAWAFEDIIAKHG
jgi:Sep-tRNA:Cys-tRNA synthetase